jgi:hypothetical protein
MKPWVKITIAIMLSVLTIVFIIVWDTVIKERIDSVKVVVVRPGVVIEEHEVISKDKLLLENRKKNSLIEGAVYKMEEVVGFEANQQLYGNSILSKRQLDVDSLSADPKKGEAIRPIPNEWIYASPSTIRRKDRIDFYLFKPEADDKNQNEQNDQSVQYQGLSPEQKVKLEELNKQNEQENEKYEKERNNIAAAKDIEIEENSNSIEDSETKSAKEEPTIKGEKLDSSIQEKRRKQIMKALKLKENEWDGLVEKGDIPLLVDIPIIYAKDGSGNEIQNGENSTEEKRLNSTGMVQDLEVLLNEDEYRLIKKYMEKGYKLYITYN